MSRFIRRVIAEIRWQQPTDYLHIDPSTFGVGAVPRDWIQQRYLQLIHHALWQTSPKGFLEQTAQHLFEFAVLTESLGQTPSHPSSPKALIQRLSRKVGPRRSSAIAHALMVLQQAQAQIEACRGSPPASLEQDTKLAQGFNASLILFRWLMECAFEATHVESDPRIPATVLNLLVDTSIESSRLAQRCHELRHSEGDRLPMYASG
ncbi:MAG TPA: hypothetical protein ENK18_14980 [Deltaproteobacteria bacterium]|nr:hypothetical protein [Deltaproteobacteria bacterium]